MRFLHVLGAIEAALSLAAGYYFAGKEWLLGSGLAFTALAVHLRAEKKLKPPAEDLGFAGAKNRISDAFLLSGIALGVEGYFIPNIVALFAAITLPHIAGEIRKLRGQEKTDRLRKYRILAIALGGLLEGRYHLALAASAIVVIGLAVLDFSIALKSGKAKTKTKM